MVVEPLIAKLYYHSLSRVDQLGSYSLETRELRATINSLLMQNNNSKLLLRITYNSS